MEMFDIVIIGGGVTGTAIARELSQYSIKIALLEKEAELAFGVSKSNSGIIHPGTQNPPASLKGKLCVAGNYLIRKINRELKLDFKEVGELIVVFQKADLAKLRQIKKEAEKLGVRGLKLVDKKWLKKNEPNLSPTVCAALFAKTAGIISPYRLVYALAENAVQNGVKIFTRTKVTKITRTPVGKKTVFTLMADQRVFQAYAVINAAGLFADDIAKLVGIKDIHISPRKGEEYLLDKKRQDLSRHLIFPLPSPTSKGILIIKTADGNPMLGPTAEEIESKDDLSTTAAGLSQVLAAAQKIIPRINPKDIIAYFAGLRPAAGNDFVIRHEDSVPGFFNVAGIQSPGLTAAPAIAQLVVKMLKTHLAQINQAGLKPTLRLKKKAKFLKKRKPAPHLFSLSLCKARELIKKDPAFGDIVCRCEIVSSKEIRTAIKSGAKTLDGIKFRTRAQAGRCHGGFCTTRIMKIMQEELGLRATEISKRGAGSEVVKHTRT